MKKTGKTITIGVTQQLPKKTSSTDKNNPKDKIISVPHPQQDNDK
jgi:hypothetical protein